MAVAAPSYTAKDVMRFLAVKRETLRYYEQIGLIHPQVDESNRYRRYSGWDVYAIAEALRLRSASFSINEVQQVRSASTAAELAKLYEEKAATSRAHATFLERVAQKTEDDARMLRDFEPGRIWLDHEPGLALIPTFGNPPRFVSSTEAFTSYARMVREDFALADFSMRFEFDDVQGGSIRHLGCTCLREPFASQLQLTADVVRIPARRSLMGYVEVSSKSISFDSGEFDSFFAEAARLGIELEGPVIALQLAHLGDNRHLFRISFGVCE